MFSTTRRSRGMPLAVVFDADHLSDAEMLSFTRWTNLSEAVFVLTATDPWLTTACASSLRCTSLTLQDIQHWVPAMPGWRRPGHQALRDCVQQCGVGLVTLRRSGEGLAFRAPPLIRSGAIDASLLERVSSGLRLQAVGAHLVSAQWVDNGAGWLAVMIDDRDKLLALKPDFVQLEGLAIGVLAPWRSPPGDGEADFRTPRVHRRRQLARGSGNGQSCSGHCPVVRTDGASTRRLHLQPRHCAGPFLPDSRCDHD
jgi:predicted PhzF superfamily epimerase YddE/YHI9